MFILGSLLHRTLKTTDNTSHVLNRLCIRKEAILTCCTCHNVPGRNFTILDAAKDCIGMSYTGEYIYIRLDNQTAFWTLEASTIMLKWIQKCQQAICVLSNQNKIMLVCISGHSGIHGNADAHAWTTFLGPRTVIPISQCFKAQNYGLAEKEALHILSCDTGCQSKLLTEQPSEKLSKDLLTLDMKECRQIIGLLTYHCTLRQHLHVMGLLDNTT
jgi:hypothetical protein